MTMGPIEEVVTALDLEVRKRRDVKLWTDTEVVELFESELREPCSPEYIIGRDMSERLVTLARRGLGDECVTLLETDTDVIEFFDDELSECSLKQRRQFEYQCVARLLAIAKRALVLTPVSCYS